MKVHYNFLLKTLIRLGQTLSLIFFAGMLFPGCSGTDENEVTVIIEKNRAVAVAVPRQFMGDAQLDSIGYNLVIHLKGQERSVLGDYKFASNRIIFTPAVPFTPGKEYEVLFRKQLLKEFFVPFPDSTNAPGVSAIFPSTDTLPENVLKLYLNFSGPMREGQALNHIFLLNAHGDTLHNTFLNLQPELWNTERSVLTIWFDPGRIKRDLIPNKTMGNPLTNGATYTLHVCSDWKDVQGLSLREDYKRQFFIGPRDSISPDPKTWDLQVPLARSVAPLVVNFHEALDYFLLNECITVVDEKGETVPGTLKVLNRERGISFSPSAAWPAGNYRLRTASRLEDLAGNNLNRLFEQDNQQAKATNEKPFFERTFSVGTTGHR